MDRCDVHQVKYWQHDPDAFEKITSLVEPVLNPDSYKTKNTVNENEIERAEEKGFEEKRNGIEYAASKNEDVHKNNIGHYDVDEHHRFLLAIALYRHGDESS